MHFDREREKERVRAMLATLPLKKIVWGVLFGGAFLLSLPALSKHQDAMTERRKLYKEQLRREEYLLLKKQAVEKEEALANKLYESCIPVVGRHYKNGTHYFTSLQPGSQPLDRITGKPFAPGVWVCDANGTVGRINKKGRLGSVAERGGVYNIFYTGNRDVIQKRLQRFKGSQYSQPVVGE